MKRSGGYTVLLTGATGFVGSAVLNTLRHSGPSAEPSASAERTVRPVIIRALARKPPQPDKAETATANLEWTTADLTDPASLHGVAEGADALVHLAARIDGDEDQCAAVNVHGTRALMDEARRAGVGRIVHLSTTAVYGPGPHRGIEVDGTVPAPVSPASRSRLAGEQPALDAGAVVLRAGLILGAGDRWVVPALAELRERVPGGWDGGTGLLSVVDVSDLARLITALALRPQAAESGVHHAAHPEPVPSGALLAELTALGVLPPVPGEDWPWEECLRRLRENPGRMSERQFALLARDHWYRSEDIWRIADCPPGPGPLARLATAAPWYRQHLR
ncbi:NAD-dependent epimerase/dehydratase family protein [Streptomyces sp. NPDC051211]|uniref:NAD-dependent epimerase/dehydratase family protein n=1 Tax=Streptomyces sp. NPDC051211 TaxID=3154643 RepID=UPI00344F8AAF